MGLEALHDLSTGLWECEHVLGALSPCESYLDQCNLHRNIFEFLLNQQVYKKYLHIAEFYFALLNHMILNRVPNLTIL